MSSQLPIATPSYTRVTNTIPAQRPRFEIPRAPPAEWSPDTVIPYVKTGMLIELSTIPLYLYAMHSIQPDNGKIGTQARSALRGVVEQEMLHLSLTGNLLSALNSSMDLYDYDAIPRYPGHILVQKIDMNLDRASKENIECFLQIEAPDTPRPPPENNEPGTLPDPSMPSTQAMFGATPTNDLAPGYKSIGDFYEDLKKGIKRLPDSAFAHKKDEQFSGLDFFDDQMVVITDQASALNALDTIIEQGEGNVAVPDSHYAVFVKLYLDRGNWTQLKVPTNPQTKDYSNKNFVYNLSLVFDAGYCYLLQTIQRVWKTGRAVNEILLRVLLLRNVHAIMTNVLTPVANILVNQKLDNDRVAAPCFNYYPLNDNGKPGNPLEPKELHGQLCQRVADAIATSPTDDIRKSLNQMRDYIMHKIPYQP